jgi:hypothetical protein
LLLDSPELVEVGKSPKPIISVMKPIKNQEMLGMGLRQINENTKRIRQEKINQNKKRKEFFDRVNKNV